MSTSKGLKIVAPPVARQAELAAYTDLFERLLDPALLVDPDNYDILDANDACERVLGHAPAQLVGKNVRTLCNEATAEDLIKNLRVARRRYHPRQFDNNWLNASGQPVQMEIVTCVLKLSDGREVLQIIAKDVTQTREAQERAAAYLEALRMAKDKLETLSITDELTGLSNVRHFKEELESEHARALRFKSPYALIFIDVDHFKIYNDKHGHPAGDEVLRRVASVLSTSRKTDLVARYGGEEFVILCRGSNIEGSLILAERLRKDISEFEIPHSEEQPLGKLTVSIGVASFPESATKSADVLEAADRALYKSKNDGRNKVTSTRDLV